MASPEIVLISPLPVGVCKQRLQEVTDPPWKILGSGKVMGSVGDARFSWRKRSVYSNAFQCRLNGVLFDAEGKTRLVCRFGRNIVIAAIFAVWFLGILVIGGAIFVKTAYSLIYYGNTATSDIAGLAISSTLLGIVLVLSAGIRIQARADLRFLTDFLQKTVEVPGGKED